MSLSRGTKENHLVRNISCLYTTTEQLHIYAEEATLNELMRPIMPFSSRTHSASSSSPAKTFGSNVSKEKATFLPSYVVGQEADAAQEVIGVSGV